MQVSDDLFLGQAYTKMGINAQPSPQEKGVGPMGRIYLWDVVPLALQAAGLAASQTPAAGGVQLLTLTAGTGVTAVVGADGVTRYTLDCPRVVSITAAANDSARTFIVYGYDVYGQAMSEQITGPNTTKVLGKKAFASVWKVTVDSNTAGAITVGYDDTIGFPVRVAAKDYVWFSFNATLGLMGAITVADVTATATTTTGDVRGTITLASVADGTKRLVAHVGVPALGCGPNATRIGALGVDQA